MEKSNLFLEIEEMISKESYKTLNVEELQSILESIEKIKTSLFKLEMYDEAAILRDAHCKISDYLAEYQIIYLAKVSNFRNKNK